MFVISRFINDICLNDKEYVLDANNEIVTFATEQAAREFLLEVGASPDEIGERYFIDPEPEA